ncbi:unnamed protein product [Chrysoparadoxa australica]
MAVRGIQKIRGRRMKPIMNQNANLGGMPSMMVFDRKVKRMQRSRAVLLDSEGEFDYVRKHMAANVVGRIEDVSRSFPLALDVGSHRGHLLELIRKEDGLEGKGGLGGIETLIQCDMSEEALLHCKPPTAEKYPSSSARACGGEAKRVKVLNVVCDEEFLPFEPGSVDLVLSNMSLHWVNDLPGALRQIRQASSLILDCAQPSPDGVFIGSMLGGNTLTELRQCLMMAEMEIEGGISQRTSPLAQVSDCGNLLQSAGFAIPTVDTDTFQVAYADMFELMKHVQSMGEGNCNLNTRGYIHRDTLHLAAEKYSELYGSEGSVTATFQACYMIGWAPHESQPKPLKRRDGYRGDVVPEAGSGSAESR